MTHPNRDEAYDSLEARDRTNLKVTRPTYTHFIIDLSSRTREVFRGRKCYIIENSRESRYIYLSYNTQTQNPIYWR